MYAFVLISRDFSFLYFLHQEEIMNEWINEWIIELDKTDSNF